MREELLDRDVLRLVVVESRQVLRRLVVEREGSFIQEDLDRGADQGLGHRAHVEDRVARHRHLLVAIPPSEGLVQHRAPVLDDEKLGADDLVVIHIALHHPCELVERRFRDPDALRSCPRKGVFGGSPRRCQDLETKEGHGESQKNRRHVAARGGGDKAVFRRKVNHEGGVMKTKGWTSFGSRLWKQLPEPRSSSSWFP